MKHLSVYILLLWCLLSCTSEEQLFNENLTTNSEEITNIKAFIAEFDNEDATSRTSFTTGPYGTQPSPEWVAGDSLGIYPDEGDQLSFRMNSSGKTCSFSGGGWAMKASSSYTAYSPFNRGYYYIEKNALPIDMTGQTQTGNDNSTHVGAYDIQIAKGDKPSAGSLVFAFERKVAFVRIELKAPCAATWKSITLESNAAFTTQATMNLSLANPTITATAQSNSVTLALENVTTTANDPNIIAYMMLLPVDLTGKTLSVRLTDNKNNNYTSNATIANNRTNFAANAVRWVSAEFEEGSGDTTPYITFTSGAVQSLRMSQTVNTLEYSINGEEWETLSTTEVTFGGSYGELRLRGKSSVGTNGATIIFGEESKVACNGDIRTLIDYENYNTVSTENAVFKSLFSGCTSLTKAPILPAITLAKYCYSGMFSNCTSLTEAPILPATTLAEGCYNAMFSDCTSLIEAPILPATTLAEYCYDRMFFRCTRLAKVSKLPATLLAKYCYQSMFYDCTSLTEAPQLPATTLADYCYYGMFYNCTNLTKAPELPATTLTLYCYRDMFYNCTNLTEAPELPATTLAERCYSEMFYDCKNLIKAPKLPATTMAELCYEFMFNNCTSLAKAPELPATTLAEGCYQYMFGGCTSLTETPKLPATALAVSCYYRMFSGCTKLTKVIELPATTLAPSCYSEMFRDCSSLTEVPAILPAMTIEPYCYSNMFYRCTNLIKAPALPATILAKHCYDSMFEECASLTEAPTLPATVLDSNCYEDMFRYCYKVNAITMLAPPIQSESLHTYFRSWLYGVASTGTLTVLPSMTSMTSTIEVPSGWTIVEYVEPTE